MSRRPNLPLANRREDLPEGHTRFVCTVAYDGTDFFGWQSQAGGNTIQDKLEGRLAEIFRKPVRIHGSGRTDSGVHAIGQVFHFDAVWSHGLATLRRALRTGLPQGILITSVKIGKPNFHARFSTCGKRYTYHVYTGFAPPMETRYAYSMGTRKLDVKAMKRTAKMLVGVHDFTAFSGRNRDSSDKENPVKDLRRLDVRQQGARIRITTEASGYLYKMVRRLAGGLIQVGLGKMTPEELIAYRDARITSATVPTAPARGLIMEKVFYKMPANANDTELSGGEE
ncbi:MAG: tRNA pseudouridine(38-40) synthase TruA [Puniceicoccales bacterium]|jgi:tRNA pseudouridine38-40 synthase|nr:tRNA pseudouridine(38-40) synthase TruA [Puniceicoccales bacterium]